MEEILKGGEKMEWIVNPRSVPGQPDTCSKNMCPAFKCSVKCNPYICVKKV